MYIGLVWRLTRFQKHDLVVLAQLHEPVDALGELHHVLDGLRDFDGTQLPHHFPGLGGVGGDRRTMETAKA